jgi:hypothetical protein
MINWKTIIFKTFLFFGISIVLLYINVFILFFTFGSGAESSRVSDLWHVSFLFNYTPLILPSFYLLYLILKFKKNNDLIKFNSNIIVLFLLIILYFYKENIINLFFFFD